MDEVFCMNCKDYEKLLPRLARHQLLDAEVRKQASAHKEICARCARELTEEQILRAGVQAVVEELNREAAPAHLEAALLNAFRNQQATSAAVFSLPINISRRRPHWKRTAIAAGLFILFSLGVFFWQQARARSQQPDDQATTPAPNVAPEPQQPVPQDLIADPAMPRQVAARPPAKRPRRQPVATGKPEVVTEFFSLIEGEELEALENGQIVRVELQGSALLEVGLPIDLAMAGESVKADVVLGHDGMARAIRFVRQ
jgi:hypothetical protein